MAIKMGIIGFGYMGKWHLNNAPKAENVSVVAAYDINPERVKAAEEAGLIWVAAYDAFTKEPVREDSERIYIVLREHGKA